MLNIKSGVLEKTRFMSNVLMLLLVAGNIFFSIQYMENVKLEASKAEDTTAMQRVQVSRYLNFFIKTVLNTQGTISFEDRVKLENDIRQIHDPELTKQWDSFVNSKDSKSAQENSVKLMSALTAKLI